MLEMILIAICIVVIILVCGITAVTGIINSVPEEEPSAKTIDPTVIGPTVIEHTVSQSNGSVSILIIIVAIVLTSVLFFMVFMPTMRLPIRQQLTRAYNAGIRGDLFDISDYKQGLFRTHQHKLRIRYLEGVTSKATRNAQSRSGKPSDEQLTVTEMYTNNDMEAIEVYLKSYYSEAT